MARWFQPSPEAEAAHKVWVAARPPEIRPLAEKFLPWELYALARDDGKKPQRVVLIGFSPPGAQHCCHAGEEHHVHESKDASVIVAVSGKFNALGFERQVRGIAPEALTPCDLPPDDELVGSAGLSEEELKRPEGERLAILAARRDRLRPFGQIKAELATKGLDL